MINVLKELGKIFLLFFVLYFVLSCATSNFPPVTELPKDTASEKVSKSADFSSTYIIGPGDSLDINVWKEPDFSRVVVVRPDGKITMPLIGDVVASGLTAIQLQEKLEKLLKEYVEIPKVSVSVTAAHNMKIYLLGNVASPGEIELTKPITVLEAISIAGGLNEWAKETDLRLMRKINGQLKTYRINYKAIIEGKDPSQNIMLKPGDTIYVP